MIAARTEEDGIQEQEIDIKMMKQRLALQSNANTSSNHNNYN